MRGRSPLGRRSDCTGKASGTRRFVGPFRSGGNRNGVAIAIALTALVLASVFLLAVVRTAVGEYREVRDFERQSQAGWLASSGIERARACLAVDPSYSGETWEVAAAEMQASRDARVVIEVQTIAERPAARQVTARSDFPANAHMRSRETRLITLEISEPGGPP